MGDGFQVLCTVEGKVRYLTPLEGSDRGIQLLTNDEAQQYRELTYFTLELATPPPPDDLDEHSAALEQTVSQQFLKDSYGTPVFNEERYSLKHLSSQQYLTFVLKHEDLRNEHWEVRLSDFAGPSSTLRVSTPKFVNRAAVQYAEGLTLNFHLEGVDYFLSPAEDFTLKVSTKPALWEMEKTIDFATDVQAVSPFIPVSFTHPEFKYSVSVLKPVFWHNRVDATCSHLCLSVPVLGHENLWFLDSAEKVASVTWGSQVCIRNAFTKEFIVADSSAEDIIPLRLSSTQRTQFRLVPVKEQKSVKITSDSLVLLTCDDYYVSIGTVGLAQHRCAGLSSSQFQAESITQQGIDLVLRRSDLHQLESAFVVTVGTREMTQLYYQLLTDITALQTFAKQNAPAQITPQAVFANMSASMNAVLKNYLQRMSVISRLNQLAHSSNSEKLENFNKTICTFGVPVILMKTAKALSSFHWIAKEQITHYASMVGSLLKLLVQNNPACCTMVMQHAYLLLDFLHYKWVGDVLACSMKYSPKEEIPRSLQFRALLDLLLSPEGELERKSCVLQLISKLFKHSCVLREDVEYLADRFPDVLSHLWIPRADLQVMNFPGKCECNLVSLSSTEANYLCRCLRFLSDFTKSYESARALVMSPPCSLALETLQELCLSEQVSLLVKREAISMYLAMQPEERGMLDSSLRLPECPMKPQFLVHMCNSVTARLKQLSEEYMVSGVVMPVLKSVSGALRLLNVLLTCEQEYPLMDLSAILNQVLSGFQEKAEGAPVTKALRSATCSLSTNHSSFVWKVLNTKPVQKIIFRLAQDGAREEQKVRSADDIVMEIEENFRELIMNKFKKILDTSTTDMSEMTTLKKLLLSKALRAQTVTDSWRKIEKQRELETMLRSWLRDRFEAKAAARRFRVQNLCTRIARSAVRAYYRLSKHYHRLLLERQHGSGNLLELFKHPELKMHLRIHYRNFWMIAMNPRVAGMRKPTMTELFEEAFELQAVVSRKVADFIEVTDISLFKGVDVCSKTLQYYSHYSLPLNYSPSAVLSSLQSLLSFAPLSDIRSSPQLQLYQKLWKACQLHTTVLRIMSNAPKQISPLMYYCTLFLWAFALDNADNLKTISTALKPEFELFRMKHYAELFLNAWKMAGRGWDLLHQLAQNLIGNNPYIITLIDLCFNGDFRGYKVLEQYCFYRALEKDPLTDLSYVTALSCLYSLGRSQSFTADLSVARMLKLMRDESASLSLQSAYVRLLAKVIDESNVWECQDETISTLSLIWKRALLLLQNIGSLEHLGRQNCWECVHLASKDCDVWLHQLSSLTSDTIDMMQDWEALFSRKFYWRSSGMVLELSRLLSLDRARSDVVQRFRNSLVSDLDWFEQCMLSLNDDLNRQPLLALVHEARKGLELVGSFRAVSTSLEAVSLRSSRSSLSAQVLSKVIKINFKSDEGSSSDAEVALKLKSALYHTRRTLYFSALRYRIEESRKKEKSIVFNELGFSTAAEMAIESVSKATDPEVKFEALLFLNCLLKELSAEMILDFKKMLDAKKRGVTFARQLNHDLEDIVIILREQEVRQELIGDKVSDCVEILRFLQSCVRNCNAPMQEYIRVVGLPDFSLVISCCQIVEVFALEHIDVLAAEVSELIISALQTLLDLVAGPCTANQVLLGNNPVFIMGVSRLLGEFSRKESPMILTCAEFLLALIEGSSDSVTGIKSNVSKYINFDPVFTALEAQADFLRENLRRLELGGRVEKSDERVTVMIKLFILLLKLSDNPSISERVKKLSKPVLDFLRKYTGHVEVKREGQMEKTYFPISFDAFYLTTHTKNQLVFESDRMSQQAQLIDFLNSIPALQAEMRYQQYLHFLSLKMVTRHWSGYGKISFCFVIAINADIVMRYNRGQLLGQEADPQHIVEMLILGGLQIFFFLLYTLCYMVEYFPKLIRDSKTNFAGLDYDSKEYQTKSHSLELTIASDVPQSDQETITILDELKYFLTGRTTLYCLGYIACSLLAMKYSLIYSLLLLDGLQRFEGLKHILKAITINKFHLGLSLLMVMVVVYLFSMYAFVHLSSSYDPSSSLYCASLWQCFATNLDVGARNGGGIGNVLPPAMPDEYWSRLIFDTLFYMIVVVVLQNVTFGIIIDTYADLRNQEIRLMEDVFASCFICGVTRGKLELRGENFLSHISDQHNVFNYICYIIYLKNKRCSGVEAGIKAQIEHFDTGFFPLDREAE